ncbi:MAG TPA: phosphopantetheine-binding protein [Streptosporangiaceae bacterium]
MTADTETAQTDGALRQRVLTSMTAVLPHVLRGKQPDVSEASRLMEDLGLTSTSTLELMLELEEDLQIQIDVEDIEPSDLASVGTLADFVATHALAMD